MACTWGSKVNGILTVFTIGIAVLIDLWDILDINKEGHTMVCGSLSLCLSLEVLIPVIGLLCKALYGEGYRSNRCSIHHLPFLLLHPFRDPGPVRPR